MPDLPWRALQRATLKVQWNGRNIAEVLQMTVDEASEFFAGEDAVAGLQLLRDIGLGYLRLGQPATELSGGGRSASSWRPSFSAASAAETCTCSTSRPPGCTRRMPTGCWCSCSALVDAGNTVVMIEHDMRAVAQSRLGDRRRAGRGRCRQQHRGGGFPSAGGPKVWQPNRSVPCTGVGAGRVAVAKCCQLRGALIVATRW